MENNPDYLQNTISMGYNVEIDVWKIKGDFYLGHDKPDYKIDFGFLRSIKMWCHAKNLEALEVMLDNDINCFWHENDDFTLTNSGYIWTYPKKQVTPKSIIVCHDLENTKKMSQLDISGVCSDFVALV